MELNLSHNRISCLPEDLGCMNALETLSLQGNSLRTLPVSFGQLRNVRKLYLSNNSIEDLAPESVAGLTQLVEIELGENGLRALPPELFLLPRLVRVDARQNRLVELPEIPSGLPGCDSCLSELFVGCNALTALPPTISSLKMLAVLDAGDNNLSEVPPEISECRQLKMLD